MAPLIGISSERSSDPGGRRAFKEGQTLEFQSHLYGELVRRYGGCPVLLPNSGEAGEARALTARLDGILLSGGSDLDPVAWGEEPLEPGGEVTEIGEDERIRSSWEHALVVAAIDAERPMLGICRGLQQLNVSLGGSLWQDLERQLGATGHLDPHRERRCHEVLVCERPAGLPDGLPARFGVTSTHHQAVREPGRGLRVFARAAEDERVVEGMIRPGRPFLLGVQWHPERIAEDPATAALMEAFIAAASGRSR
jgi:putative glutamine amidotransferase